MLPWIVDAQVISQDPDGYRVYVSLLGVFGGAGPTLPVQVLSPGPRDGVRTRRYPLPTVGTVGTVAFTRNDSRNGRWLGSHDPNLVDASAHAPGLGGLDYAAHHGGGWSWLDPDGTRFEAFPDGTTVRIGPTVPAPTRHTLDSNQARVRTPFTAAERSPVTPGAFPVVLNHPSGASASLSVSGGWSVVSAAGQAMSVSVAGGGSITINADGSMTLTPSAGKKVAVGGNSPVQLAGGGTSTTLTAG